MSRNLLHNSSNYLVVLAAVLLVGAAGCASSNGSDKDDRQQPPPQTAEQTPSSPDQQAGESTGQTADQKQKPKVSDAQLKEYLRISQQLKGVQVDAQQKMRSAQSKQEARKVQQEARGKIQTIFDDSSMTKSEFRQLGKRIQSEPALRQRLQEMAREQQGQPKQPEQQ